MLLCTPVARLRHQPAGLRPLWLAAALAFVTSIVIAPRGAAGQPPLAIQAGATQLESLQQAFQRVVDRVAPSVVSIRVQRRYASPLPATENEGLPGRLEQHVVVNGAGTVITPDGLILTNEHVVQSATAIDVFFHDGAKLPATLFAADARSDIAILKVPRRGLQPASFGDWSLVERGQWAIVLGNPYGLGNDGQLSVSIGVIANLNRQLPGLGEVDDRFYNDMIQVTAPIYPGNSGGPLFNVRGELIGIVTAMHTRAPADEGVGFAIPLTPIKRRIIDLLAQGRRVEYGYLGLTVRLPESDERAAHGLKNGVVVERVEPGGPAARAGVAVGDIITSYERLPISGPAHLAELAGQTPVGTTVRLDLLRNGRPAAIAVTLDRRDISRVSWMRGEALCWRGMRLSDLSADARRHMRVDARSGGVVVIDVEAGSPADQADIRIGDVIEAVGGQRIADTLDFMLRVRDTEGTLELTLRDRGHRAIPP